MSLVRNPAFSTAVFCKQSATTWQALKDKITNYGTTNAGLQYLNEATVRGLDPAFMDDALWNMIKAEMGL